MKQRKRKWSTNNCWGFAAAPNLTFTNSIILAIQLVRVFKIRQDLHETSGEPVRGTLDLNFPGASPLSYIFLNLSEMPKKITTISIISETDNQSIT